MKLPEYVPKDEVKRECKELGIRNWAALKKLVPSLEEAKIIRAAIGAAGIRIGIEAFRDGLEVELEHGTRYPDANVTNNHPVLTGKIVIAHLYGSSSLLVVPVGAQWELPDRCGA